MSISRTLSSDRGAAFVMLMLFMVVVLGAAALAIDVGLLMSERTRLQAAADASALAGASKLPNSAAVKAEATQYASLNHPGATILQDEIVLGHWDKSAAVFTPGGSPNNAVHVTVKRVAEEGTAVTTFLAGIFGATHVDVAAAATATGTPGGAADAGSRFIVDDEMIDSDVPVIENLAYSLGVDSEELISDMDGDWFIDLPPGTVLELPTGQVGDEGVFDIDHPEFPFGSGTSPSFADFLNYNEDSSSWRYDLIPKESLDPLLGVSTVSDASKYHTYVNPEFCQVSPVYKSDVSALNPIGDIENVNALGWRRGLLAFKILAVGADPDGSGSVLPNLVIEVCDPLDIDLDMVEPGAEATVTGIVLQLVE